MKYDTTKLKPFDLEKAKAGDPVCTRDGKSVDILSFNGKPLVPIVGYIEGESQFTINIWMPNGCDNRCGNVSNNDLMMAPKTVTKWANVYRDDRGKQFMEGQIHNTEKEAKEYSNYGKDKRFVATVKIEWEE